jgi:hypothetical protein
MSHLAKNDRTASTALIGTYRQDSGLAGQASALIDATRNPLAAAHLLIDLLEHLEDGHDSVLNNVACDFNGTTERLELRSALL